MGGKASVNRGFLRMACSAADGNCCLLWNTSTIVEQLVAIYAVAYPDFPAKTASNYVGQLWSLLHRMQIGELVVLPLKTTATIAVGRVSGPYEHRSDLGPDLSHVRPVDWQRTDVPRDAFDQDLLYSFGAFLTFGQVRRDNAEKRILAALAVDVDADSILPLSTKMDSKRLTWRPHPTSPTSAASRSVSWSHGDFLGTTSQISLRRYCRLKDSLASAQARLAPTAASIFSPASDRSAWTPHA